MEEQNRNQDPQIPGAAEITAQLKTGLRRVYEGAKPALTWYSFVAGPVLVWLVIIRLEVAPPSFVDAANLVLAVVLFVLALPCSALFRLDDLALSPSTDDWPELTILIALLYGAANFVLFGLLFGGRRRRRAAEKKQKETERKRLAEESKARARAAAMQRVRPPAPSTGDAPPKKTAH